jgi:hypothetical protein
LWKFTVCECETIGERIGQYRILVERSEGRRLPGKPRLRCEDNIKKYFQ